MNVLHINTNNRKTLISIGTDNGFYIYSLINLNLII